MDEHTVHDKRGVTYPEDAGRLYWRRPLLLYLLTILSTTFIGYLMNGTLAAALMYAGALMFLLTCHEFGHYLQARRYGVPVSLPHFIPMPIPPFGTMGALIVMGGTIPNRRALFDVGISGPLAGLLPSLLFCWLGVRWSYIAPLPTGGEVMVFGEPLLLRWMVLAVHGPYPPGTDLMIHPVGMAGWVGLFITSLNLMPFGQLDGGHVFYALFGRRSAWISRILFVLAFAAMCYWQCWVFLLMFLLVFGLGIGHPPTRDDAVTPGPLRRLLGVATLAFVLIGFTPYPLDIRYRPPVPQEYHWNCRSIEPPADPVTAGRILKKKVPAITDETGCPLQRGQHFRRSLAREIAVLED